MKNKAYSLHIGVAKIDPAKYRDHEFETLPTAEADAWAMNKIADSLHYEKTKMLLTKQATRQGFVKETIAIRDEMKPGDLFLLTFAGHGSQVLDTSGDEADGYDETWCFYDGHVLDDEIHGLLKTFPEGTRVLIISDSCFSGSIIKDPRSKELVMMWGQSKRIELSEVSASVHLLSSCQEYQISREARANGLFTTALLEVWDDGNFEGNYKAFYYAILAIIPRCKRQTPNHLYAGSIDEAFDDSKPFSVGR